jgi:hypothetical protein
MHHWVEVLALPALVDCEEGQVVTFWSEELSSLLVGLH